jgi:Rieske Fe-S protein
MPYIPVEIDDEGFLRGIWPEVEEVSEAGTTYEVARTEIGGQTYSSAWYQYCGRQTAAGIVPSADQSNYFLAAEGPDYEWQSEALSAGDRLNVEDFQDYQEWGNEVGDAGVGKPAQATWRSEGEGQLPVVVIRSPIIEEKAQQGGEVGEWYSAAAPQGFIAYLNVCTHFCCVPGYKESGDAATYDIANGIYCQCHQSQYDPFTPEFGTFVALPRPD